jgi:peptidoglycan/xylan/chitin deacetylase (PgdA/CDA1 family)
MRGATRIRRYRRMLADVFRPPSVILMYHRVAPLADYPFPTLVSVKCFKRQMACLRESYRVARLTDMAAVSGGRADRRNTVAVTFDDGYADNLTHALPILKAFAIPATIFVSSGYVGRGREYWWDDLARIFEHRQADRRHLTLTIGARTHEWDIRAPEEASVVRKAVHHLVKGLRLDDRERVFDTLRSWAGVSEAGRPEHLAVDEHQLRALASSDLIDIGGHTVNHPRLGSLPREDQRKEISSNRSHLERLTGTPVRAFAYPFGQPSDFTDDTVDAVREAGFDCACSTVHARVSTDADPYRLPRYPVDDWEPDEFRARLRAYFDGAV